MTWLASTHINVGMNDTLNKNISFVLTFFVTPDCASSHSDHKGIYAHCASHCLLLQRQHGQSLIGHFCKSLEACHHQMKAEVALGKKNLEQMLQDRLMTAVPYNFWSIEM